MPYISRPFPLESLCGNAFTSFGEIILSALHRKWHVRVVKGHGILKFDVLSNSLVVLVITVRLDQNLLP